MAAVFPTGIKTFTAKVDLVDNVLATHVNQLQEEVTALETALGTGTLVSTWAGGLTTPGTHSSITARFLNIEAGLVDHTAALSAKAATASPTLSGVPTAPTAAGGTNTTQIATTAFTHGEVATHAALTTTHGVSGTLVGNSDTQTLTNKTISGSSNTLSNIAQASVTNLTSDLALKANLAGPSLTGVPTAPTAAGATSTTQIATTAFTVGEVSTHAALTNTHGATGGIVGESKTQTLTNKTMDGGSNTFTNIPWSAISGGPSGNVVFVNKTASFTPALVDVHKVHLAAHTSVAIVVTLPQDSDIAFAVGATIPVVRYDAAGVSFVAGAGATVNYTPGLALRAQNSLATAVKTSANTWLVSGDLA